ncbi:antitoxin of toxin-antitoxin stability system [Companilactobacillus kedongensis]|uniref:antitoxin of toxin-antitoxin stability system n=1 Tax=Companilactobacillus kedongensis TaxID=2486004 RepID=UPI000F79F6F5|nr:antitoxin of toxin-antitoxin stability system [Companilactobacillus kedongensis]
MKSVKLRKVGSSKVLTVPKEIKTKYENFDVFSGRDGAIVFLPKSNNPFTDPAFIKKNKGALSDEDFIKTDVLNSEF